MALLLCGVTQHFHPSCAKEDGSGCYMRVDSTMGTFFKTAYCPQHADEGYGLPACLLR